MIAEAVDGVRDTKAYVVWGRTGPEVRTQLEPGDDVMVECETDNAVKRRARLAAITLDPAVTDGAGRPVTDIATRYDAMFWSESAVEKFVLPYYMRYRTPAEVGRIRGAFDHPSIYAMVHPPASGVLLMTSIRSKGKSLEALTLEEFEAAR